MGNSIFKIYICDHETQSRYNIRCRGKEKALNYKKKYWSYVNYSKNITKIICDECRNSYYLNNILDIKDIQWTKLNTNNKNRTKCIYDICYYLKQ